MAETAAEEGLEQLKHQTWHLKVLIHCEGCKKQVKKVIKSIDGVYTIDVDSQQQKVTVMGNVKADTLIKKLLKTGKHAELWPEKPGKNEAKPPAGKSKGNNKKENVRKIEGSDNGYQKKNSEEKPEDSPKKGEDGESEEMAEKTGGNGGGKKKKGKKVNSNIDIGSSSNSLARPGYPAPTLYPDYISPPQYVSPYAPVYYMLSPHGPNYYNVAHPSTSTSYLVDPVYANTCLTSTNYPPN